MRKNRIWLSVTGALGLIFSVSLWHFANSPAELSQAAPAESVQPVPTLAWADAGAPLWVSLPDGMDAPTPSVAAAADDAPTTPTLTTLPPVRRAPRPVGVPGVSLPPRQGRLADPAYRAARVAELRAQEDAARARARAWAAANNEPMRQVVDGTVIALIDYTEAGGPMHRATLNLSAGISTAADLIRNTAPYNVNGATVVAGIWDGGSVRATHTEFFDGRVTNMEAATIDDHATHVAGTMIARGASATALGMAPNARLRAYDFFDDILEMTAEAMADPSEANTLQISNHSYGFLAGWAYQFNPPRWYGTWGNRESDSFGRYIATDRDRDRLLFDAPYYLPFIAAGNDRNNNAPASGATFEYFSNGSWRTKAYDPNTDPFSDGWKQGGYNTIPFGNLPKNAVVVGAVNDAVTNGMRDLSNATMAPFSSWGYTDDGRIKPDIVANGISLTSSRSGGDTSYGAKSGTSMSAPNASGSSILLVEHFGNLFPDQRMWNSTIRGLIIHTADSLSGNGGPDYRNGWGLMNTKAAADLISLHASVPLAARMVEDTLTTAAPIVEFPYAWDGENPLKVTLTWTDPQGPTQSALNSTTRVLVNDLDLRLIHPNGSVTNFPWILDPLNPTALATTGDNIRDNVEQIVLTDPASPGTYTIRISRKGTLTNNEQHFSLFVSGAFAVTDAAELLRIEGATDFGEVRSGTSRSRTFTLHNDGLQNVTITNMTLPNGFSGSWTGSIAAGASRDAVITFAPDPTGPFGGSLSLQLAESDNIASTTLSGTGVEYLTITHPAADLTVPYSTDAIDIGGTASTNLVGSLTWTNAQTADSSTFAATTPWALNSMTLSEGANLFTISGTNHPADARIAQDSANASWTSRDNGGFGFHGWILESTGANAGHFIATSAGNANLNISSPAWGLYAHNGGEANAYRPLAQPLAVGDSLEMVFENNWLVNGSRVGMGLLNADGEWLFEFYFVGGQSHYQINDAASAFPTSLAYTDAGVTIRLTRTGSGTYDVTLNGSPLNGRSFAARSNMQITRLRVFNANAAGTASPGSNYDVFFNHLSVERIAPAPETFSDSITVTRLGPPPDEPEIFMGQVEDTFLNAYWTPSTGATGYVLDVHTDASFTSATASTGGAEDFSGTGASSATFRNIMWTNNAITWTGVNVRNNDTITGPALTLNSGGGSLQSSSIEGGIETIRFDHRRLTTPAGATLEVYVNGALIGTVSPGTSVATAQFSVPAIQAPFAISITNTGNRIAAIDNLSWTNTGILVGAYVPGYSNLITTATNVNVTGLEAGSTYYLRVKAVGANGESHYAVTNATTLGQARQTQTIDFDPITGDIVTTNIVTLHATASSGLPVTFTVLAGPADLINGNQLTFHASGEVIVQASQAGDDGYQPAPGVHRSFFVNKATPTLTTLPAAGDLFPGQSLADSSLTGGEADTQGVFEWAEDTIEPPLGPSTQTIVFIPENTAMFNSVQEEIQVSVRYPILSLSPESDQWVALPPRNSTNLLFTIGNQGDADLNWSASLVSYAYAFFDDMESGTNSWTRFGGNVLWNISTNRTAGGLSAWHSGYDTNMFSYLVTPPILLGSNTPMLVLDHWIDAELMGSASAYHGGLVAFSTNGVNFFLLEPTGGYPYALNGYNLRVFSGSHDWSSVEFDLSSLAGQEVELAFVFITDNFYSGLEEGWYIDNVAVYSSEDEPTWISLASLSGVVSASQSSGLTATISAPAHLADSRRQAFLTLETNDPILPSRTLSITLEVLPPPPPFQVVPGNNSATNSSGEELPTLRWTWAANRIYSVIWTEDTLGPEMTWTTNVLQETDFTIDENGIATWSDPNPLNAATRYYRLRVQQAE